MNLFNVIILVVLFFFAFKGLLRGLVNEASSLAGLLLGAWLAYRFHQHLSAPIRALLHVPSGIAAFLAFMVILLAMSLIAHLAGNLLTAALRLVMLGGVNRIGGFLLGAAEGALLLSLLFSTATADFMPAGLKAGVASAEVAHVFARTGDRILAFWRSGTTVRP
jgi:membrane protein required for colicin V production